MSNDGKPSTDVIRRVFEGSGRYFIEVGPCPDDQDVIELRTNEGEYSAGYWGKCNISLSPEMARELGLALIAAARDKEPSA